MTGTLHRAPFVVPVTSPLLEDGGVLCQDGVIAAVGRFCDLKDSAATVVDHEGCILTPALINGHAHLELSYLAELGRSFSPSANGDITAWIRSLLERRARPRSDVQDQRDARLALADLAKRGCAAVADIGNLTESRYIGQDAAVDVLYFLELLGLSRELENAGLKLLQTVDADMHCTAHAPYSTSPALIKAVKARSGRNGAPFPIHVAESGDEIEFLRAGTGRFRAFLEERGAWDGSFAPPGTGAVEYLDGLGVLDEHTVCIHAVHVSEEEIGLLRKRRAKVCLCPGSNRFMGVGKAQVPSFLEHGLLPALGTDSLTSNRTLNIWREMRLLTQDHPGLDPETVFRMATLGGARAFGISDRFGALAEGRAARFLAVHNHRDLRKNVFEFLATDGEVAEIDWVG